MPLCKFDFSGRRLRLGHGGQIRAAVAALDVGPSDGGGEGRMSKHETAMTRGYWGSIGGLLKEEFCLVRPTSRCGVRLADAVILPDRETRIAERGELVELSGQRVIVVQTKASRLGMYLMGQTLFSA